MLLVLLPSRCLPLPMHDVSIDMPVCSFPMNQLCALYCTNVQRPVLSLTL